MKLLSVTHRVFSKEGSTFCSLSCLILNYPIISKSFMFIGAVIVGISVLISPQFPQHTEPTLIICVTGIGILVFGSWFLLRHLIYRFIEEYILHFLCKNPQKPVNLLSIITYASRIDASAKDVQFVIDNLERKRIITRTPKGIIMRLFS